MPSETCQIQNEKGGVCSHMRNLDFAREAEKKKNEERDQQRPAEMGGDIEGIMKGKHDQSASHIRENYNNEL